MRFGASAFERNANIDIYLEQRLLLAHTQITTRNSYLDFLPTFSSCSPTLPSQSPSNIPFSLLLPEYCKGSLLCLRD